MNIIELADIHVDPKWIESQQPCFDLIIETVIENKIDVVCISGDIFNKSFYATDKDKFNLLLDFIGKLKTHTEIVMVTGTQSHDAPGSCRVFQEMGCHVLNPQNPEIINGILFIGLPEINKSQLMAKKNLNKDQSEVYIKQVINVYIDNYWKPIRENNKDKPCVFMGHGVFVDNPYENNPIIKNTDIVIDNNQLKEINADRYIFGHIHTPSESKILNGGYPGFMGYDDRPWGSTGFQPGFNLTVINKTLGYSEELKKILNSGMRKQNASHIL